MTPANLRRIEEHEIEVSPSQLCLGLFVRLPGGWMDHPFLFNAFRITTQAQLDVLRGLQREKVVVVPERSTAQPLPLERSETLRPPPPPPPDPAQAQVLAEKQARAERAAVLRNRLARCEKVYEQAAVQVRGVMRGVFAASEHAIVTARELVGSIVRSFDENGDTVLNLIGENAAEENAYFHPLNVMILSLLLGKQVGLSSEELLYLGEGALFHDIGKNRVPDVVLRNSSRNRHEEEFYRLHTVYGQEIAADIGLLHAESVRILVQHHETIDGKGYPKGLSGKQLSTKVRIVGMVNRYDNLCNPPHRNDAATPAEAIATMFKRDQSRWDPHLLQHFVRLLGVYPPGSIVQLSNGNTGIVVSVDRADLLRPSIMLYDPGTPKSEALIVDLATTAGVKIDTVLRPEDLSPPVLRYLAAKRQLSYYHGKRED